MGPFVLGSYLVASFLFLRLYLLTTHAWTLLDYEAFTHYSDAYWASDPIFRWRVLMPLVAGGIARVLPLDLGLIYQALALLCVLGLLVMYQKYLANFVQPGASSILALAIVSPMLWNFCLLNIRYFPFDLPALLLFAMGSHFIYRRKWFAYYPILALATLNRESACFLIFVFLFCLHGTMSLKQLFWHLAAQALLWCGLRYSTLLVLGGDADAINQLRVGFNAGVISDMFLLRGNALKDWAKLLLSFGGVWLVIPWVFRRQPPFLKRSLLVVIPFVITSALFGIIDEIRLYSELIPILLTPVVYALAAEMGGAKCERQAGTATARIPEPVAGDLHYTTSPPGGSKTR